MTRRHFVFLTLILTALLFLSGCASEPKAVSSARPSAEALTQAKDALESADQPSLSCFHAITLAGEEVTESIFAEHQVTTINIWGTFCNPCISEMPELAELNSAYEDGQFQVVGLVVDMLASDGSVHADAVEAAWKIIDATGADYPHLLPSDDLIRAILTDVSAVPESIFVDSEGNVLTPETRYLGARSYQDWKAIVDELLASSSKK